MTWKLYTLSSAVAVLATVFVSFAPDQRRAPASPAPTTADWSAVSAIDLGAEADRLRTRLDETISYHAPARDAFRFGAADRRVAPPEPSPAADEVTPVEAPRAPFTLVGMATSSGEGRVQRTAILSSGDGVRLVREGDRLDGGYRVVAVGEEDVTIEPPGSAPAITLRLPTP